MNIISKTSNIELLMKKRQLLKLEEAQPRMAIECKQGVIWVTSSGDYRDHMLSAGQCYVPVKKSQVVIEALHDARVDIAER
jgi:Protein of unknown function (DUF2917)